MDKHEVMILNFHIKDAPSFRIYTEGKSVQGYKGMKDLTWAKCCIKLNLEGQGRQPPTMATKSPPAVTASDFSNRQPPSHLKFDFFLLSICV